MRLKKPHERRGTENRNSRLKEANVQNKNIYIYYERGRGS